MRKTNHDILQLYLQEQSGQRSQNNSGVHGEGVITHLGICRSYEMINVEVHLKDDMGLKDYMWLNLKNLHLECPASHPMN